MIRRHVFAAGVAVVCVVLTTSCTGTQDTAVADTATRLLEAVSNRDGETACSLLAPAVRTEFEDTSGKPCARAVLDESLENGSGPVDVRVFDTAAQAVIGSETVFLSRFDGQWLVIAAACAPMPDAPYDCGIGMP